MPTFIATFFLLLFYFLIVVPFALFVQFFRWLSFVFNPRTSGFTIKHYKYTKRDFNS